MTSDKRNVLEKDQHFNSTNKILHWITEKVNPPVHFYSEYKDDFFTRMTSKRERVCRQKDSQVIYDRLSNIRP